MVELIIIYKSKHVIKLFKFKGEALLYLKSVRQPRFALIYGENNKLIYNQKR